MAKANEVPEKHPSETRNGAISFVGMLDDDETLTGTPTITSSPSGLSISNAQVNSGSVIVNGKSVAPGKAVTFSVSGGSSGVKYEIQAQCSTSAGQQLIGECFLQVLNR